MIEEIQVNGFRSLIDFRIRLQPGINVLVGANGTGKSNFITFLDFLSEYASRDLNSAIAIAHGAGSVFSKEMFDEESATLTFSVSGRWKREPADKLYSRVNEKATDGLYRYDCTLKYSRAIPAVYIASERLSVNNTDAPPFCVYRRTDRVDRAFKHEVSLEEASPELRSNIWKWLADTKEGTVNPEIGLANRLRPELSILRFLEGESTSLAYCVSDLSGYRSVNIDPALARKPTPVGAAVELEPTGVGLAGALYRIRRGEYFSRSRSMMFFERNDLDPKFESIVSWCKEVNPSIHDVDVSLDFVEAQLRPSMTFSYGGREELFPFARISDGTVKWLALVTILLAEPNLNIIEEPENFLHPFMQESFISLCRNVVSQGSRRSLVISTHSPTLLDFCEPTELTIFETNEGRSRATRVSNHKEVAERIGNSRFGLGHYYRIGALYGADSSSS